MGRSYFYRLIIALLLQLIIAFSVVNPSFSSTSNPTTADKFVHKVHSFNQVVLKDRGNWSSPQSPWYAYIDRQFEEGLSPAQQKRYLIIQTKGWCKELLKLEKTGFLNLYPELPEALSDKFVKNIFFNKIIPTHSYGFRRCQAHAMLNPIIEEEKKRDLEFYYLSIPGTNLGNKLDKVYDNRQIILRKAFKILFDLAACEDFKPAINDILKYNKLFLIFVGHREQYYFYIRAKHYALEAPDTSAVAEKIRRLDFASPYPQYNLMPKLIIIENLLALGDLDAARKIAFHFSYISCGRSEND